MSETIQPALTAEQWAEVRNWKHLTDASNSYLGDSVSSYDGYVNERHALVAIALHGQPFGFTREEAAILADLVSYARGHDGAPNAADYQTARGTIAKIRALLPPE